MGTIATRATELKNIHKEMREFLFWTILHLEESDLCPDEVDELILEIAKTKLNLDRLKEKPIKDYSKPDDTWEIQMPSKLNSL